MKEILFGVAFGQLMAAVILVVLQLAVSIFFWWLVERAWQTVQGLTFGFVQRARLAWSLFARAARR